MTATVKYVSWYVTPCSLVYRYRCFWGKSCPHSCFLP